MKTLQPQGAAIKSCVCMHYTMYLTPCIAESVAVT